jgi:alginate O-acetyltransferase complex protein AlgI
MAILSLKFLEFVLVTLVVYFLLPGRWQNLFLLATSYFYYYTWHPFYPLLLFVLTAITFGMGHWLHKTRAKRAILWTGILINVGAMLWFLIGGKILQQTIDFTVVNPLTINIMSFLVLPIGMSYYALNSISYLIDINLRLSKPTTNFVDFALYLAWFPKLISGPLERARKFRPQLDPDPGRPVPHRHPRRHVGPVPARSSDDRSRRSWESRPAVGAGHVHVLPL